MTHSHEDTDEQNSFDVKVILYSITFVGLGIALLGFLLKKDRRLCLLVRLRG